MDLDSLAHMGQPRFDGTPPPKPPPPPPPIFPPGIPDLNAFDPTGYDWFNDKAAKALAYLLANPDLWSFIAEASRKLASKRCRFGMKMITENARFLSWVNATDPEGGYKISNNHTAYFGRILVHYWPEISEFIEMNEVDPANP